VERDGLVTETRFGSDFTVGIEEELLLVDPGNGYALAPTAHDVLPRMTVPAGAAGHEAFAAELELRSPPCRTAGAARAALAATRAAARTAGACLLGAGIHPVAAFGEGTALVALPRYARVADDMRGLICRTPECALHVHVGMPDAETALRVFNGLRRHLPLLEALAANSPWWFGRDSGLASARYAVVQAYPGRGVPRAFWSWDEYESVTDAAVRAGEADDYTHLWWDVRPHPRLGTVELREMDAQSSLDDVAAHAALVQCLARWEAERPDPPRLGSEALGWSAFAAARDGMEARLIDDEGALRPARELAAAVLRRIEPIAAELDCADELAPLHDWIGGAARQRAAVARGEGLPAFLAGATD
jgi:glutamate---cysteine ligase / carboxylate-amine ligase